MENSTGAKTPFKLRLKHVLLGWLKIFGQMIIGWFIYIPVYMFFGAGIYIALQLTGLSNNTYWQCVGLVFLIRYLKNAWKLGGDAHVRPDVIIHKEPYQVAPKLLPPGLCMYGKTLLFKTESGLFFGVKSGEIFEPNDRKIAPTQISYEHEKA